MERRRTVPELVLEWEWASVPDSTRTGQRSEACRGWASAEIWTTPAEAGKGHHSAPLRSPP